MANYLCAFQMAAEREGGSSQDSTKSSGEEETKEKKEGQN